MRQRKTKRAVRQNSEKFERRIGDRWLNEKAPDPCTKNSYMQEINTSLRVTLNLTNNPLCAAVSLLALSAVECNEWQSEKGRKSEGKSKLREVSTCSTLTGDPPVWWQERRRAGWRTSEGSFPTAKPLSPHTLAVDGRRFLVETERRELVFSWQDPREQGASYLGHKDLELEVQVMVILYIMHLVAKCI